jgi:Polyketide cyclase / dehydrase and lipid transport
MTRYQTRLRTPQSPEQAFAYMADLRNFAEWDPGVRRVAQVQGNGGGPGAVFDVTLATKRGNTLRYHTAVFDPPHNIVVIAKTSLITSEDRITVDTDPTGTIVTYDADLRLNGPLRVGDPLLRVGFKRIADRATAGLQQALPAEPV